MGYLFTSESVSEGHPDKVADQISDAVLDELLKQDANSKVACETMVTSGLAVVGGEINTNGYVSVQDIVRRVIDRIGYNRSEYKFDANSCGVISLIHDQSGDIYQGVERGSEELQGAGDQGMMFGYACKDTAEYMPLPLHLSHLLLKELAAIRKEGKKMSYLRPDSKAQVTMEYDDDNKPVRVHTIVISTQHDPFNDDEKIMLETISKDIKEVLIPRVKAALNANIENLFDDFKLLVNPTGKFVIGGPHGDTGLTGRKIIVDTYGGMGAHGGGAFSGKDCSKVDRSAAYAARHIAKNMVAAGVASEMLVQLAYAIGVAEPVGIYINTFGSSKVKYSDSELAGIVEKIFDLRPGMIVKRLGLKNPIFTPTACYGHFGREPYSDTVTVLENGVEVTKKFNFFTWEKLDYVDIIKKELSL
ncbi:methionine adenosyltransferase [Marinilabiliaceae bacterium ANBcel2]|nr:methionine adenosyltransferase [Marinilabiliaceae bacterium ANBcel2]